MFLDQILRVEEIKEFEKELAVHQLATLEVDKRLMASTEGEEGVTGRRAPINVLDRAVMEHNVLACAKVGRPVFSRDCG
jgi:COP9 signalosome complex subunit 4